MQAMELRLRRVREQLALLTDAYLDGTVEKELFDERKTTLLFERKRPRKKRPP